ncbi:hypothetical protein [Thomasclavelia cocleata]|uniref:hypothetical protein n=1 Tax=Thomasclavelia cocleata TaxID=69824 RepID=UPI003002B9B2
MTRVKCIVNYDGSKFHGFQIQNKLRTVQGEIQKALKNICKEEIIIHGSGRTDAKVHGLNKYSILIRQEKCQNHNGKEQLITFYLMIFIFLILNLSVMTFTAAIVQ